MTFHLNRLMYSRAISNGFSTYGLAYLNFRFWVGAWVFVFLMIIVAFDLSAYVSYITRFTEESFAVLISLIFTFEAFKVSGGYSKLNDHAYCC